MHDRLDPGATLGDFVVERHLARGGMADVYLARERSSGALVALKVIAADLAVVQRELEHEARAATRVRHPNVASVLGAGVDAGRAFLVMEHVDGVSVRDLLGALARVVVPIAVRLHVIAGAARGLHAAHEACDERGVPLGLVHRDVSPSNVLLARDGHARVIDFGIAKTRERATQTRLGVLKGKLSYMSPEQAAGARLDARSDVFSLGVVLHELLSERKLFAAPSPAELRRLVVRAEIPPLPAHVPASIAALVTAMLQRDPASRPGSAREVAEIVDTALRGDEAAQLAAIVEHVARSREQDDAVFEGATMIDD
ncbi:serine/threonine-protein kinase [Sandaracinus amylolyticus]|uniref:serine/threonine-protein kinase n=1 Tax=Sandaracinus amylolyticus TaxID=927083 RepID=UPI001F2879D3|nr:serine/threonine-protein kinase [Sandaracinus amylolyticus]UJR83805.1 Hypothetical protein I5071_58760 [Sandaracinus amylolyticus]